MKDFESSLKRLRTDRVDLLQLHCVTFQDNPDDWDKPDGVLRAFRKLRDQKAVRFLGITGHEDAVILRRAFEAYQFDTVLTALNPAGRRRPFREDLLPAANRKKMGVIAMKVMGGGNGCLAAGNPSKRPLRPFHDDTSNQVPARTLGRYALGLPVSVALIGVASVKQLRENVSAARDVRLRSRPKSGKPSRTGSADPDPGKKSDLTGKPTSCRAFIKGIGIGAAAAHFREAFSICAIAARSCGSVPFDSASRSRMASISGTTPRPSSTVPFGATIWATGYISTAPFGKNRLSISMAPPGLRSPTTTARPMACSPAARTSLADPLSGSTSRTSGPR